MSIQWKKREIKRKEQANTSCVVLLCWFVLLSVLWTMRKANLNGFLKLTRTVHEKHISTWGFVLVWCNAHCTVGCGVVLFDSLMWLVRSVCLLLPFSHFSLCNALIFASLCHVLIFNREQFVCVSCIFMTHVNPCCLSHLTLDNVPYFSRSPLCGCSSHSADMTCSCICCLSAIFLLLRLVSVSSFYFCVFLSLFVFMKLTVW